MLTDTTTTIQATLEHSFFHYMPAPAGPSPQIRIVTVCVGDIPGIVVLGRCMRGQSLQSWEWAIIYDPADSIVAQHLETMAAADARITVVACPTPALLATLHRSMSEATCDYLCRLNCGSLIEPTFLEKCLWVLATNSEIAFCNAHSALDANRRSIWTKGFEQGSKFLEENFAGGTYVIRHSVYMSTGGYSGEVPLAYAEWDLWLRCARTGRWGYTIPEPLIWYPGLDPSNPFRPAHTQELQSFRQYLHERYGELRHQFPSAFLTPLVPYTDVADDAPIVNDLLCLPDTKRILLVVPWLVVGGADRVNLDFMRYLTSVGYEFTIATTLPSAQHGWEDEFAVYTPDIFILERFLRVADIPRFLLYLIHSRKIDTVMVSNSYLGYQLLPYLRSRCPDVTFVDYCHAEQEYWKNGGYPRCAAAYQELLDLNITSSLHVKEWMVARGAQPDKIEVCYTNIDTERWKPDPIVRQLMRTRMGLTDDMTLVIFVGRLTAEKRPRLIPQMIQGLLQRADDRFLCLVIGDGPERDTIEQQTRSLRLGQHLRLLGRLSDADLRDTMAAADVLLLPSESEGIAVAIFEAMAMGLVPVSVRAGGQSELVTPECGVLIPHGPNELAEYTNALLRLIEDRELCRTMGAAACERVARVFPLSALGPRMAALLAQAQANRQADPRPIVGYELGREYGVQVVEQIRLERLLDEFWVERESWRANPRPHPALTIPPLPASRRRRIARFVRIKTAHWVQWGADHGLGWLRPLHEHTIRWAKKHGW